MERALQERVIGAIVLVIFIVLVVPVFLDGPATDIETISEPVVLPGQNGQQRKRQTIVLERDRTEPVPRQPAAEDDVADEDPPSAAVSGARNVPPPGQAEITIEPEPTAPAEAPATEPAPAATTSASDMWAVQLGSFSKKDNAERLAADLRGKGYAAFISQLDSNNGPLHRVRIGPQKDRESAQAVVERLAKDGQKGQLVPHP